MIAALNDLDVMACDIGSAYINAPFEDIILFKAGSECGEKQGKVVILLQSLYGIKTSGASWQSMFNKFIEKILFGSPLFGKVVGVTHSPCTPGI